MANNAYHRPEQGQTLEDHVRAFLALFQDPNYGGFDATCMRDVKFVAASAEKQSTEFELTITSALCNMNGILHGGAAATILDMLTSTALFHAVRPGILEAGHVSRTITMTYLRPVPEGTKVLVEASIVGLSNRLANLEGKIKTLDGKVCASCTHDKAVFKRSSL